MTTTTAVDTIRLEVRKLDSDGNGWGEPLAWGSASALQKPRVHFIIDADEAERLLLDCVGSQRPPFYDVELSKVTAFELPPVGSLGWTAGRG